VSLGAPFWFDLLSDIATGQGWRMIETVRLLRASLAALVLGLHASVIAGEGHLVLVGGGPTPAEVFERTLALSGGRHAIVAVLPQTFPNDTIGDAAVAMWRTLRAADVIKVSRTDPATARAALERATLIWMPGGFPGHFMRTLAATPLAEIIRERFVAGVTIGGASAGAVAMSRTMLADDVAPDGTPLAGPATVDGLGLWPEAIVSPHFTERRRLAPLIPIVRDHPDLIGIGLDEGTAVIVFKGAFDVLGRGTVSIVDAGRPEVRRLRSGAHFRYRADQ
jgi:cyanophycinase